MACSRCGADVDGPEAVGSWRVREREPTLGRGSPSRGPSTKWCKDCERLYDKWVRRHANDIVWQALVGTVIVSTVGLGLPLLGVGSLVAAVGAFAGFGAMFGLSRLTRRRRRRQFLQAPLPRAYLPAPK